MKLKPTPAVPSVQLLEAELKREKYRGRYKRLLRGTISTLIIVVAAAMLISHLLLPMLHIYGSSMSPTLTNGDIVAAMRYGSYERGDIVAFYYNEQILVKRIIGLPGEMVDIDADGNVSIDGEPLDEPYVTEKSLGECDIELPYQVPEGRYFVMGDNRGVSSDSRSSQVGCIAEERIIGEVIFTLWPLSEFGTIE